MAFALRSSRGAVVGAAGASERKGGRGGGDVRRAETSQHRTAPQQVEDLPLAAEAGEGATVESTGEETRGRDRSSEPRREEEEATMSKGGRPMHARKYLNRWGLRTLLVALMTLLTAALTSPAAADICENCPLPEEGGVGGGGGGSITPKPPMIAVQTYTCLGTLGTNLQTLAQSLRASVADSFAAMRKALGVLDTWQAEQARKDRPPFDGAWLWPTPDVRVADCTDDNASPGTNIGVWFEQPGVYGKGDTDAARRSLTEKLAIMKLTEGVAIKVDDGAFRIFMDIGIDYGQYMIDQAMQLKPLEAQQVFLDKFSVTYDDTNKRVVTRLDGHVNGQLSGENTDFWTVMTDSLFLRQDMRGVFCDGEAVFDYGSSIDTIVLSIFDVVFDAISDYVSWLYTGDTELDVESFVQNKMGSLKGVGCGVTRIFPTEYLVPEISTMKLVYNYKRLTIVDGVTAGGELQLVPREPAVGVAGPFTIWAEAGVAPTATFTAVTKDLRPPLTFTWQGPGGTVSSPDQQSTQVTWNLNVDEFDEEYKKLVTVTVTDADGVKASGLKWVTIKSDLAQPEPIGCISNCDAM
jgi:hypothetical protein